MSIARFPKLIMYYRGFFFKYIWFKTFATFITTSESFAMLIKTLVLIWNFCDIDQDFSPYWKLLRCWSKLWPSLETFAMLIKTSASFKTFAIISKFCDIDYKLLGYYLKLLWYYLELLLETALHELGGAAVSRSV